jgi:hypothetical protein
MATAKEKELIKKLQDAIINYKVAEAKNISCLKLSSAQRRFMQHLMY